MSEQAYSLWLVGGTALLVEQPPSPLQRYVLESVLYAQLRADKQSGPRFTHYDRWYNDYRAALEARGWVVTRSHSDYRPRTDDRPLAIAPYLCERLQTRHPRLAAPLQAAVSRLLQADAQAQLRPSSVAGTQVVYELGVILPGPSLELYSLAFDGGSASVPIDLGATVAASATRDGIDLRESQATMTELLSEANRQDLHALIERKQLAGHIKDLGFIEAGGAYGQS
ncbi:hypothetical protein P0Y43_24125 [Pseudomonas entomophila]|uniref:hypothetical protein n=1 Tax=Pseudomonas entomophila TaxID=312306 RepID=UPI0023D87EDD|nr:hypothetical protein [Pseudomonas entomophila]MDF0733770.1 hypothetical protein [Pseudomonas entomophila]